MIAIARVRRSVPAAEADVRRGPGDGAASLQCAAHVPTQPAVQTDRAAAGGKLAPTQAAQDGPVSQGTPKPMGRLLTEHF
eukprot:CAMPEP_0178985312 /NCGR_PEP_ID=MMETSP0795-20121207/2079_1 /TAXON_ID=88552 /ORGANISM="Amoebophrya sp., Strain Ameob2" /LENGTH=79 /DNA_ID=CAMNT_0020676249 /DNA_START=1076 /DNA_END=1315 /DNA_ORIENTATION=-